MERILVIGCPGGGKSTLANTLCARLNLPVTHLDKLWWMPGWVELGREKFVPKVEAVTAGERWIIDGNYSNTFDIRMPRADAVIWIDQPRMLCMRRVLRRAVTQLGRTREDVAPGCPERLDIEFFRYVWTFKAVHDEKIVGALDTHGRHAKLVRLRSDREIAAFIGELEAAAD